MLPGTKHFDWGTEGGASDNANGNSANRLWRGHVLRFSGSGPFGLQGSIIRSAISDIKGNNT